MNAKKAKALRRLVRNMNNMEPPERKLPEVAYREITSRAKFITVQNDEIIPDATNEDKLSSEATPHALQKVKIATGQVVVDASTQRAVYHHLKRELVKTEKNA